MAGIARLLVFIQDDLAVYTYDGRGNRTSETDADGHKISYTYDALGRMTSRTYDAWGMPESPNKLLNNDHGNYVFATFTGHIYDTTLDIYFAEARFYDANNRIWLAVDPIKDGGNWYQYCSSNPKTYWDPTGLWEMVTTTKQALLAGSEIEPALFWRQRDFFQGHWWQSEEDLTFAYEMLLKETKSGNITGSTLIEDYNYYDYFGYANTRVYTLQALIGAERTGIYDIDTRDILENVLVSQNVDIGSGMIELTPSNLEAARNWYDNQIEILKKGAYELENGWDYVFKGLFILGIGFIYRDVETISATENITKSTGEGRIVWTGKDKYVPELANSIESEFPGKVKAVERILYDDNGFIITDLDIEMDDIIIQIKSGSGKGLTSQMVTTAEATGKTVISYTPDIKQSAAVLRGVRAKGFETFTDTDELLKFLEEFWN